MVMMLRVSRMLASLCVVRVDVDDVAAAAAAGGYDQY